MLKWIALVLMIVDHFAYVIVDFIPYEVYIVMRGLGRLSFPVFVYYVVLGLGRTSNLKVYMGRMFSFALLAEIAKRSFSLFRDSYVNVIFSLFLYGAIYVLFENKVGKLKISKTMRVGLIALLLVILPYVEYGYSGFLVFFSLYFVHKKIPKGKQHIYSAILITLSFVPDMVMSDGPYIEWLAGFSGLLMFNDNLDKRILTPKIEKWTFYWVYPLQFVVLGIIYYYIWL